jgi:hypothetical protein
MTGQKIKTSKKALKDISLTAKSWIYFHLKPKKFNFLLNQQKNPDYTRSVF